MYFTFACFLQRCEPVPPAPLDPFVCSTVPLLSGNPCFPVSTLPVPPPVRTFRDSPNNSNPHCGLSFSLFSFFTPPGPAGAFHSVVVIIFHSFALTQCDSRLQLVPRRGVRGAFTPRFNLILLPPPRVLFCFLDLKGGPFLWTTSWWLGLLSRPAFFRTGPCNLLNHF